MVSASKFLLACTAVFGALAAPFAELEALDGLHEKIEQRAVSPGTGTSNGFFYSFWTDGQGSVTYNNGAGGSYDVQWSSVNNFVAGKGWNPGASRVISYNGTWNGASVNSVSNSNYKTHLRPPPFGL
jgi:endo-1,4-beta-xylanase